MYMGGNIRGFIRMLRSAKVEGCKYRAWKDRKKSLEIQHSQPA